MTSSQVQIVILQLGDVAGAQQQGGFKILPPELRKQIWKIVSYELKPRQIEIKELDSTDEAPKFEIIGGERPAVAKVCQEATAEIMANRGYKLLFKVAGSKRRVVFGPTMDTIKFSSALPVAQALLSQELENKIDMQIITHLIIEASSLDWRSTQVFHKFTSLRCLKNMIITDAIPEEGRKEYLYLDFYFEADAVDELIASMFGFPLGPSLTPIYALPDGQVKKGIDAMSEMFELLVDDEQKQHLMDIWSSLDKNFDAFTSLASLDKDFADNNSWPTRVNIRIDYLPTSSN
ncbi:hypothetical protein B7494_g2074 [Chlorociboria aeruginascens]|nr:hypothetical protein B7494_g2074 [Chlorociboria aeruginascens]